MKTGRVKNSLPKLNRNSHGYHENLIVETRLTTISKNIVSFTYRTGLRVGVFFKLKTFT